MKNSLVNECNVIELTQVNNRAGNISIIEQYSSVPFSIERIYYLYDTPCSAIRGGHAHKELSQLIVAASGSFNLTLDDGISSKTFFLNNPNQGLLVVPGIWRDLRDFSSGSI